MEESLSVIAEVITEYQTAGALTLDKLTTMLRRLSIHDYKLADADAEYSKKHSEILYSHTGSVARAKIDAEYEVPELRQIRKISGRRRRSRNKKTEGEEIRRTKKKHIKLKNEEQEDRITNKNE